MADILIAGGGIAGSSLAIMLGRKGFAVQLFEKAHFPREKPCGEGLMPAGVAILQGLDLSAAVGGCPFHGVRFHFGTQPSQSGAYQAIRFRSPGLGQRRKVLDQVLLSSAAATYGVQVHTGAHVEAPITENGTVVGLRVGDQEHRAPLVIAADGAHSTLRKQLGLDSRVNRARFGVRAHFRLPNGAADVPWVEVFVGARHEIYVTPLPAREIAVAILARVGTRTHYPASRFLDLCRAFPPLAARLEGAEQISPIMGASPLSGAARLAFTPGAVLLGDAAGFVDPITGTGMTQALLSAELLANHLVRRKTHDWAWQPSFEHQRRSLLLQHRILPKMALWLARNPNLARPFCLVPGKPKSFRMRSY